VSRSFRACETRADFGIEVGDVKANFARIMERKDRIVSRLVGGINELMRLNKISVVKGSRAYNFSDRS